jgi:hypothetical protein
VYRRKGLWTPEEEQRLKDLWVRGARGDEVIAAFPERTLNGIRHKAYSFKFFFKDLKAQTGKKKYERFVQARSRIKGDVPMINDRPAIRTCLTCGIKFMSAGPQNRLCQIHRNGNGI